MPEHIRMLPLTRLPRAAELISAGQLGDVDALAAPTTYAFDPTICESFLAAVAKRYGGESVDKSALDAYMAPRIHSLFRLPRNIAGQPGVWTWVAAGPMRPYMELRWSLEEYKIWRYTSTNVLRNGISRLWWGAEMLRSGGDYSLVEVAFKSVRWFQFVSELKYSMHRECARAFTRALDELDATDERAQDLSKRFNVYLKARALEAWDYFDASSESTFDDSWAARSMPLSMLTADVEDLAGPSTGVSRNDIEEELLGWLLEVASESKSK